MGGVTRIGDPGTPNRTYQIPIVDVDKYLLITNNLSDVPDKAAARANLGLSNISPVWGSIIGDIEDQTDLTQYIADNAPSGFDDFTPDATHNVAVWNNSLQAWEASQDFNNWNTAFGWGDHAGLYAPILGYNNTDWDTAFGWGDHAGLYKLAAYVPDWSEITNKPSTFYTLPTASGSVLGGVKVGSGLSIDGGGILSAPVPAHSALSNLDYATAGHTGFASQANLDLKAMGNPGICLTCAISANDISIDYTTRVLTLTPSTGTLIFFTDGGGILTKHTKVGAVQFPAFTDTSGLWHFYFDNNGNPVTTLDPWTDFAVIAPVYRILWNATLSPDSAKAVAEHFECHEDDISADVHAWMHKYGAIWYKGFDAVHNRLVSGAPNADGRNTVFALTTGTNYDDNLEYDVTNSTAGTKWTQDLGNTTAASLNATNSALFKVRMQTAGGLVYTLPATRFPFPWNSVSNRPEYVNTSGVRNLVSNNYFFVVYVFAFQDPRPGDAIRIVTADVEFSTIAAARAHLWSNIQTSFPALTDGEIRPLYKLIFEYKSSYDVGCKYSVLREVSDIRKAQITQTTAAAGSILATSVVFTPVGNIVAANAQAAIEELDTEKAPKDTPIFTGNGVIGTTAPMSGAKWHVHGENRAIGSLISLASALNVVSSNGYGANIGGGISLGGYYTSTAYRVFGVISGKKSDGVSSNKDGYLSFETSSNATGTTIERMRITANGDVGIGIVDAAQRLTVSGGNILLVTATSKIGFENDIANFNIGYVNSTKGITGHSYYGWTFEQDGGYGLNIAQNSEPTLNINSAKILTFDTPSAGGGYITFKHGGVLKNYIGSRYHLTAGTAGYEDDLTIRSGSDITFHAGGSERGIFTEGGDFKCTGDIIAYATI